MAQIARRLLEDDVMEREGLAERPHHRREAAPPLQRATPLTAGRVGVRPLFMNSIQTHEFERK